MRESLPPGSWVARENYTPSLTGAGFRVHELGYFGLLRESDPARFDFLITSSGDYGRFVNHPDRYPVEARAYQRIFDSFEEVRRFERSILHAGPTIRILATERGARLLDEKKTPGPARSSPGLPSPRREGAQGRPG